eukprot:TRINITY_DN6432_c0_g1_i1.p1 TRINITY_DN6432_c0_g1~~TRINITY_DN6432_c0_g1_i1.p1  ORF type:complete len:881 (-),score=227.24 TRINITY_DN6432_c0_g1_i1:8-2260(-)
MDGRLYTFGSGYLGRLGHGNDKNQPLPCMVDALMMEKITYVACGGKNTAAIADNGTVYIWGYNQYSQVGVSDLVKKRIVDHPVRNAKLSGRGIVAICIGDRHMGAYSDTGTAFAWGSNEFGALGIGTLKDQETPIPITFFKSSRVICMSMQGAHSAAVTEEGQLYTWGRSTSGRLGYSVRGEQVLPQIPDAIREERFTQVVCGTLHTIGLTTKNQVWIWGSGKYGQTSDYHPSQDQSEDSDINITKPYKLSIIGVNQIMCGGYHTVIGVTGLSNQFIQHTIDGSKIQLENMLKEKSNLVNEAFNPLTGQRPLHIAVASGHSELVAFFIKHKVQVDVTAFGQRTALHLAAELGQEKAAVELISYGANLNFQDEEKKTPLHFAIINKHTNLAHDLIRRGALLDAVDVENKTPLDYCSFEEAYPYKETGDRYDVVIVHAPADYVFAKKLKEAVQKYFIRCYLSAPSEKNSQVPIEVKKIIMESRGAVWIASSSSVKSEGCTKQLQYAKSMKRPLYPIWLEKITFDSVIESLVFRRQMVDFSEAAKFNQSVSQLVTGLRNLFRTRGDAEGEDEDEDHVDGSAPKKSEQGAIFISFDVSDKPVAESLQTQLEKDNLRCVLSNATGIQQNSRAILGSRAFILILSTKSVSNSKFRDLLALAENHGKPLFPVAVERGIKLDPAMQYTLAKTPKFYVDEVGYLQQLIHLFHTTEKIEKLRIEAQTLTKKASLAQEQVKERRQLMNIYTAQDEEQTVAS